MPTDYDLDLERIALQECELVFTNFDSDVAWRLGSRLRQTAVSRSLKAVIDIRRFGEQLFYTALAGTTPDNFEWVRRKSNVVQRFYRSSYSVGLTLARDKSNLLDKFGLSSTDYMAHGGSFPLTSACAGVIGSVTVSGLPQRRDHELVIEAICAELNLNYEKLALPLR